MPNSNSNSKPDNNHLLTKLKEYWDIGKQYYARDQRRMRMLDMTDNGDRWRAVGANFEPYQILPDTNQVSYVKENILASLYTTAKSAEVLPTSEDDAELCTKLNLFLQNLWSVEDVGYKMYLAGERAALLNLGITQVGWDEDFVKNNKEDAKVQKGRVLLKNINPMNFMRDPFSASLQDSGWCCTYDRLHKYVLKNDPRYKDAFKKYLEKDNAEGSTELLPGYGKYHEVSSDKNHFNVIKWWLHTPDGNIDEIHTIDTDVILYVKENIKPSMYPFVELYCNVPSSGLVGISCPAKIYANDTAYNLMNSLALTAEYKNQRPPKFVNSQSGLNIAAFTKHGAEADRTFLVQGDAERAVHYHQFPIMSPNVPNLLQMLQNDVQNVTGVDGRYTGRDTGSIITTGGTEEMLNRVTMIDTPKILNYEKYAKDLTKMILLYLIEYSPEREVYVKQPNSNEYENVSIKFPDLKSSKTIFNYEINISSDLPKNKQRMAAWADMIMEKQMQYRENGGGDVQLLTEEEWLMFQDVPQKEYLLERMGFERDTNALKEASQTIFQYAQLVEQGMSPEDALLQTAQTLKNTRAGKPIEEAASPSMPQAMGPLTQTSMTPMDDMSLLS